MLGPVALAWPPRRLRLLMPGQAAPVCTGFKCARNWRRSNRPLPLQRPFAVPLCRPSAAFPVIHAKSELGTQSRSQVLRRQHLPRRSWIALVPTGSGMLAPRAPYRGHSRGLNTGAPRPYQNGRRLLWAFEALRRSSLSSSMPHLKRLPQSVHRMGALCLALRPGSTLRKCPRVTEQSQLPGATSIPVRIAEGICR